VIALGFLGCLVVVGLVLTLTAFPRHFNLRATYRRVAWLPVAALVIEAILWKPLLTKLSYFAVVPLLLTCVASLVLTVVGATLSAAARERHESSKELLRATIVAAIPGMLLLALILYGLVSTMLEGHRA
jgi:TRAP-type C4-dicarboxylate transport system permease large subunit